MCGLTLLPRNVRPTIFLLSMSMKAMSLESRSTIMTTFVGSGTFTTAALSVARVKLAAPTVSPTMRRIRIRLRLRIRSLLTPTLESRLQPEAGQQVAKLITLPVEHVLQHERQPQTFGQLEIVIPLGEVFLIACREVHLRVSNPPRVERIAHHGLGERETGALVQRHVAGN